LRVTAELSWLGPNRQIQPKVNNVETEDEERFFSAQADRFTRVKEESSACSVRNHQVGARRGGALQLKFDPAVSADQVIAQESRGFADIQN
jgi:hypothetical protein